MKSTVPVRVRLANETFQTTINMTKGTFKETSRVGKNIFGKIDDLTVCIEESNFIKMKEDFEDIEDLDEDQIKDILKAEGFMIRTQEELKLIS